MLSSQKDVEVGTSLKGSRLEKQLTDKEVVASRCEVSASRGPAGSALNSYYEGVNPFFMVMQISTVKEPRDLGAPRWSTAA